MPRGKASGERLLNYTTQIEAIKTVGEIQGILVVHKAKSILIDYDDGGNVEALAFKVDTAHGEVGIRLPIDADAVLKVLIQQNRLGRVPKKYLTHDQAVRVAWRIVKHFVEANMAMLETEQVKMEQIFLHCLLTGDGRTMFQRFEEKGGFLLTEGKKEES